MYCRAWIRSRPQMVAGRSDTSVDAVRRAGRDDHRLGVGPAGRGTRWAWAPAGRGTGWAWDRLGVGPAGRGTGWASGPRGLCHNTVSIPCGEQPATPRPDTP